MTLKIEIWNRDPSRNVHLTKLERVIVPAVEASEGVEAQPKKIESKVVHEHVLQPGDRFSFGVTASQALVLDTPE